MSSLLSHPHARMSEPGVALTTPALADTMERDDMADGTCSVEGCLRDLGPRGRRGMCSMHYQRWLKDGDPGEAALRPSRLVPTIERFWAKVDKTDDCWLWTGVRISNGYGSFRVEGAMRLAHRFAYELLVGPIPDGLQIDHLCRVKHCVNPLHLEPVTQAENVRRGHDARGCIHGHPWTEESTYIRPGNGARQCRICRKESARRHYLKRRAS